MDDNKPGVNDKEFTLTIREDWGSAIYTEELPLDQVLRVYEDGLTAREIETLKRYANMEDKITTIKRFNHIIELKRDKGRANNCLVRLDNTKWTRSKCNLINLTRRLENSSKDDFLNSVRFIKLFRSIY